MLHPKLQAFYPTSAPPARLPVSMVGDRTSERQPHPLRRHCATCALRSDTESSAVESSDAGTRSDVDDVDIARQADPPASASTALWTVPWDNGRTVQTMVQMWCIAIPVGFGGVQIAAQLQGLPLETLTPADRAVCACFAEVAQLAAVVLLIRSTTAPYQPLPNPWFKYTLSAKAALTGAAGGACALAAVSLVAAIAPEHTPRSETELRELLFSGDWVAAGAACTASAVLAPLLEEIMYRGFLLASLTKNLAPSGAVAISSLAFAAAHLSGPDFVPLATLGAVLGATFLVAEGNLLAPTLAHGLYNAVILLSIAADGV